MPFHQPTPAPDAETQFSERQLVETPEQIDLELPLAGIGSRFLAIAIDTLIQLASGAILALVLLLAAAIAGANRWHMASLWLTAGLIAAGFLLYFGYFAFFEIVWAGQTPGKRRIGIRVIKDDGRSLSPAEAIGRNLLRILDQLPGFYAVGVLTALVNRRSKRLGDFVAGSIVVYERALSGAEFVAVEAEPISHTPLGASHLSNEEIALIDAFLARRYELPPEIRRRMAREILDRVAPKLMTPVDRQDEEKTLEDVLREYRAGGR